MKAKVNRASMSQQAIELIRERIVTQKLAPGQRLDEAALAEQLGISRTPVREAFKVLSAEGMLVLRPRQGCFVAELSLNDLEEIFPIMAMLEGRVAQVVAKKSTAEQMKTLDALHDKLERSAASGDIDAYYATNFVFHDTLQKYAGNRWLQVVIGDLRQQLKLSRHQSLRLDGRLDGSLAEHRALMKALHARDADAAKDLMHNHLIAQLGALREIATKAEQQNG